MGHATDAAFCKAQLDLAALEYDRFRKAYTDPTKIPRSYKTSVRLVSTGDWTSGFPAGSFWLVFEHTGDSSWRTTAETWTDALYGQRTRTSDHDIGFIIYNTYGNGYRLTNNSAYLDVVKTAAGSLITRFNSTVGAIRSWNYTPWTYPVIIDNMMNLELLWSATELGGNAQFAQVALTHALTTQKDQFRQDGSSYHVVDYNPTTGAIIAKKTAQGIADESAWARGQAWGLYGFTMAFRKTQDPRFLTQALAIADFYTRSPRMPSDRVPYFDFDAPIRDDVPDHRDASAGAIAASGLIELSKYAPAADAPGYLEFALTTLRSLSSSAYRAAENTNGNFLLMHSVGNYPNGEEVDVGINYADYYYLEALLRCKALK
jgi:hypothetical protein